MEIYSKNGDSKAKSGVYLEHQDSSVKKGNAPSRPPVTEFPASTLPSDRRLVKWNSTPAIHQDFSEFTFPLARKLPDAGLQKPGRKSFLRSTEHVLATFYGLVFIIEGTDWHILKSEYLPIYFVRVSVKNVKYPFRILVIDNESEQNIRVVDFIVNCKTKTSIKEDAVCWQDQETFGAKFSKKSQAFQFYDTISRMASTLRKGEELENENLDKIVDLEVCLPNMEVRAYQFLKTDKLKDVLKLVCKKEKLNVNEYYFHHMQRTDDSLNMALRVEDIRTDKIRLISKRELRGNSNDAIEKVSMPGSKKKSGGMISLFRRRFSRKRKESPQYSSAPSVIQYTDNVFMVERQSGDQINDETHLGDSSNLALSEKNRSTHSPARATKSDITDTKSTSSTMTRHVKRMAPQPPMLIIPKPGQSPSSTHGVNGVHTIDGKQSTKKRRAPSPPRNVSSPGTPGGTKPPRPKPPNITSNSPTSLSQPVKHASNGIEKKKPFPVFIAPPPPDSTPPPIDECETPVGPIDSELDDGSVEIPVEINGVIDDTKSLDSKSSENHEEETKATEQALEEVEVKVELTVNDSDKNKTDVGSNENDNENNDTVINNEDGGAKEDKTEEDKTEEDKTIVVEEKYTVDGDLSLNKEEEITNFLNTSNKNKSAKVDENENSLNQENIKNMTPEQLQAFQVKTQNPGMAQQDPLNLQNQQLFAMQQNQQMISNILLQQMFQQQMQAQQRAPTTMVQLPMGGVLPVSPLHHMQLAGGVNPMQPAGIMSPVGTMPGMQPNGANYPTVMWPNAQPPAQPLPQPVPSPPSEPIKTDESTTSSASTSTDNLPKEEEKPDTKISKAPPPVKDEELVNRPLFKKMLAQVSQGKIQGIPKIANQTQGSEVKPSSPVSPTAKIAKVPTSYVASAEKNIPQAEPEQDKTTPISLGEIGRKSSYVDSAIGRQNNHAVVENAANVATKIPGNTVVSINRITTNEVDRDVTINKQGKPFETNGNIETSSHRSVMPIDSGIVSFNPNVSSSIANSIKHETPKISSNVVLPQSVPTVNNNKTLFSVNQNTQAHTINTTKPTSPISPPNVNVTGRVSGHDGMGSSKNTHSAIINHNPSQPILTPTSRVAVVNQTPTPQPNPLVNSPKPHTPTHASTMNSVARHAAQVAAEKRNSQQSSSNAPSQDSHTSHKLIIEEPVLETLKFPRTTISPLSVREHESKTTTGVNRNGHQLSYNSTATGRLKTGGVKAPEVAQKPKARHLSEPKPTVSAKPTYDMRKSKTLPKTKKPEPIQLSLSLTPEERMQIHKSSGLTTTTNAAGR